jgi:indolepyruvate ferredoxin oxidoreductase alpha subunit
MKHVGLNVAADPLFTLGYTGINGGLVIINADDPGLHSSQDEQDNRYYARAAKIGMLEPSDSQECKDMIKIAFELSEKYDTPMLFRVTTRVCHSKSIVELSERVEVPIVPYVKKDKFNPVPAISKVLHTKVEERLKKLSDFANTTELNYIEWGKDRKIGVVSAGIAYQYAKEVYGDSVSYLKLGFTFPMPIEKIRDFASQVETLIVVEELEPFMEDIIKAAGIPCIGKVKIPIEGELNPDIVRKALLGIETPTIQYDKSVVADRPPVLCAGCPHRGFFYELGKLKNVVVTSDIGCYGLAPKDIAICMGGGFSVSHGAQKVFNMAGEGKRCVGVMGDSTFFHSGMTSLLEAVYNNSNALYVVLDNRITGMTGHQENPGSGFTAMDQDSSITDVAAVAKALGVKHIKTIDPNKLADVKEALNWGLGFNEPAVIITRWPCILKRLSEADKKEFGNFKKINKVEADKCIGCKMCVKTGCPALEYHSDTKKVTIDKNQCTGCDVCVQVCPKDAIVREVK